MYIGEGKRHSFQADRPAQRTLTTLGFPSPTCESAIDHDYRNTLADRTNIATLTSVASPVHP
jgi:hypothetical protein